MKHVILIFLIIYSTIGLTQYEQYNKSTSVKDDIEFLNEKSFKHKVDNNREITVVEFYAEWNAYNQCNYLKKLTDCKVYRVNIEAHPRLATKYEVKVVPTIIIFDGGTIKAKYEANLLFQASGKFSYEGVQENIEKIILEKFQ
jgi:thiol-disulfide isomerase/thioredoxin